MPWYVAYTKPKNEKKVNKLLADKGVTVYCPMQENIKQWSDRKKKVIEPVFRSYVFVFLNDYDKEKLLVLETPGIVNFVWWLGKPGIVRDVEIEAIRSFLTNYKDVKIETDFKPGDLLTISEGPLKEVKAELVSIRGSRAILVIKNLGLSMSAEVPTQILVRTESQYSNNN
jgi:transcription antitermination factor NusG